MAVGSPVNTDTVNNLLTGHSVALRNICQNIQNFNIFIGNLGPAGLQALGFSAADAASAVNSAAILNTVAAIFYGTATQATEYDFYNALASLYSGQ